MDMNKLTLTGRVANDIKLTATPSGISMCNITIAVNRMKAKDAEKAVADFPQLIAWRDTATFIAKHFKKGDPIAIEACVRTRIKESDNGKQYLTELVVDQVYFVGYAKQAEQAELCKE